MTSNPDRGAPASTEGSLDDDDSREHRSGGWSEQGVNGDGHGLSKQGADPTEQAGDGRPVEEEGPTTMDAPQEDAGESPTEEVSLKAEVARPDSPSDSLSTPDDLPSIQVWP